MGGRSHPPAGAGTRGLGLASGSRPLLRVRLPKAGVLDRHLDLEIRPIIDKEMGPWYISLNPTLDLSFKGQNSNKGPGFAPNLKISYEFTELISGGIEYYGALGPLKGFDPLKQQEHLLFSVVDLDLGPEWEFNFGVGFGLTPATDRLLVKMILGYRFDFFAARGGKQAATSCLLPSPSSHACRYGALPPDSFGTAR